MAFNAGARGFARTVFEGRNHPITSFHGGIHSYDFTQLPQDPQQFDVVTRDTNSDGSETERRLPIADWVLELRELTKMTASTIPINLVASVVEALRQQALIKSIDDASGGGL